MPYANNTNGDRVIKNIVDNAINAAVDAMQRFFPHHFLDSRRTRIRRQTLDGLLHLIPMLCRELGQRFERRRLDFDSEQRLRGYIFS